MGYFHVTDPAINASHGTVFAASETDAKAQLRTADMLAHRLSHGE